MKKSTLLSAAFLLFGLSATTADAQVMISANINDLFITNFNGYGYPNSFTIDYSPFCTGSMACMGTNKQLTALVADDGATPMLYVNDQTPPVGAVWTAAPIPGGGGGWPDVVVGNDFANPGCYIAGVVTVTGGNVKLYLYRIKSVGVGGGALSIVGGVPFSTITVSSTGNAVGPAHIDIACQYSLPYMGLARANKFVITWKDNVNGIMAYASTLNAPAAFNISVVNPSTALSSPDVAYVERAGGVSVAEFAYVDQNSSPNKLFYSEWQTAPLVAPGGPTLYDNTRNYINPFAYASVLRIDGIDDFTQNTPGGGNATFCIATSAPAPGSSVWVYNDITGPFTATNITAPVTAPGPGLTNQTNEIPVVACGPSRFYSVGFFSDPVSSSGGAWQNYFAIAVDWSTGVPTSDKNAYEIMKQSYDPAFVPGLALSATCNTNALGVQDLFAGYENYAFLLDKYSIPVAGYNFKSAHPAAVASVTDNNWHIFPNPATDQLNLQAPSSFNSGKDHASYDVSDISGKTLFGGEISDTKQSVNVHNLPAGTYIINVHPDGAQTNTIKFVKE